MRLTIVPSDTLVIVDGIGYRGIGMSSIDSTIHAVQWYGDKGEVEYNNGMANEVIDNIEAFSVVLANYTKAVIEDKKNSPPNSYSVWNDKTNEWVEDAVLKASWELAQSINEKKAYLASTDWYYARLAETKEAVPQDVVDARIAARDFIRTNTPSANTAVSTN